MLRESSRIEHHNWSGKFCLDRCNGRQQELVMSRLLLRLEILVLDLHQFGNCDLHLVGWKEQEGAIGMTSVKTEHELQEEEEEMG